MSLRELTRDIGYAAGIVVRRPFHVLWQITNRCNLRCTFCEFPLNAVAPEEELTLDDFRRIEGELFALGRFLISIEGGEPFLRPDLVEIVRILGRHHVPLLYTSGWHATPGSVRALYDAGLAQVGVSIDFADPTRHDLKRGAPGTAERAWRAVELFRDAAPHGGKQVHVMTVLMEETRDELEPLLKLSAAKGVGHHITLLSTGGDRRSTRGGDEVPRASVSAQLLDLWKRYPHFRIFRDYLATIDSFLARGPMPQCHAGEQAFNIDHVGNVAPCIEKIQQPVGNLRRESLATVHARMKGLASVATCQDCWTACRGYNTALGQGGTRQAWTDLMTRMRSN